MMVVAFNNFGEMLVKTIIVMILHHYLFYHFAWQTERGLSEMVMALPNVFARHPASSVGRGKVHVGLGKVGRRLKPFFSFITAHTTHAQLWSSHCQQYAPRCLLGGGEPVIDLA